MKERNRMTVKECTYEWKRNNEEIVKCIENV
jgi:hypothetical protein